MKSFFISFITAYVLISLPAMLGFGYVIDWEPDATFFQKFKGYVLEGLAGNYIVKLVLSTIAGVIISLVIGYRRKKIEG